MALAIEYLAKKKKIVLSNIEKRIEEVNNKQPDYIEFLGGRDKG